MTYKFIPMQYGRSMIEMLGVLSVVGILSVAGITGYSQAMAKNKLTKAMEQLSATVTSIRAMYSAQPNYSGLTTATAIQMGLIDVDMLNQQDVTTASKIFNAFSGSVDINAVSTTYHGITKPLGGFEIKFSGLSKDACVQMATANWGTGSGIISVQAGENQNNIGKSENGSLPLNMATAISGCNEDGNGNSIIWIFY